MDKILITTFDAKNRPVYAIMEMIELLLEEGLLLHELNKDAIISYSVYYYKNHHFSYLNEKGIVLDDIKEGLIQMKAVKHLSYLELDAKDNSNFWMDMNQLSEEENLRELHKNWIMSLNTVEVVSFKEKYNYLSHIVGRELMNISEETITGYQFLLDWEKEQTVFDLERLYSVAVYGEIEKFYWQKYFPDTDTTRFLDQCYSFAVDGGGGHYVLWNYEGLDKEPPVVFFGSEGEMEFLASTLAEYLIRLPDAYNEYDIEEFMDSEEYNDTLYDCVDDYEEKMGISITEEEVEILLKTDYLRYKEKVRRNFSYDDSRGIEEKKKFEEFINIMNRF